MFNLAEEFPQISPRHAISVASGAALLVLLVIGGYVYLNLKPLEASGEISLVTAYPFHAANARSAASVPVSATLQPSGQIIVLTEVTLTNQASTPLPLSEVRAVVSLQNEQWWSDPVSPEDFSRIFVNYPELSPLRLSPIRSRDVLPPGESVHGLMIFHFPFSIEQWNQRSSFAVNLAFATGKLLALPYPKPAA